MKRGGFDLQNLTEKKARMDQRTANGNRARNSNRFLSKPIRAPVDTLHKHLKTVRSQARKFLPKEQHKFPITKPFCEVECRLGILGVPHAVPAMRVASSGAKKDPHQRNAIISAFECPNAQMVSGVSRTHFLKWASYPGISEISRVTKALGVNHASELHPKPPKSKPLLETTMTETVYAYGGERRVAYPGEHTTSTRGRRGKMEAKEKLGVPLDLAIPASPYDVRISVACEKSLQEVGDQPAPDWKVRRVKRRRSFVRRDGSIAWQIDITEVTSTDRQTVSAPDVHYEIEFELQAGALLKLINEEDEGRINSLSMGYAQQLWWIISQINPMADALDVEEVLREHPDKKAVHLALAQCLAFRRFMAGYKHGNRDYKSPIARPNETPPPLPAKPRFSGCMPINFRRHHIEDIQRSPDTAYFISEKTDGVRHFMVFTGNTVVLVDRKMKGGKQPIPVDDGTKDPFDSILKLVKPGTVLDGEVVMNRRAGNPRPIFIVFDVLSISPTAPILQYPFEDRLDALQKCTFCEPTTTGNIFDPSAVNNPKIALPLVRKNFVKRTKVDELLSFVVEEKGMRIYRNGSLHNHLTDGIIFQPNLPYECGTDRNLLKWKYLDTVTIDVEIMPGLPTDDDDTFHVACLGDDQTRIDMSRHVRQGLPAPERMKLEADRCETKLRIAEVGLDPETGDWYYLTMRPDKTEPNYIDTVMGSLLELAEGLTMEELRYRMSTPAGMRDTYWNRHRRMLGQLVSYHRTELDEHKKPSAK